MKTIKSTLIALSMGILSFGIFSLSANENNEKKVVVEIRKVNDHYEAKERHISVEIHKSNNDSAVVDLNVDGSTEVFELADLEIGETQDITAESGKIVTLSRTNTGMSVVIDGNEIDLPHVHGDMQAIIRKEGMPLHTNIKKGIQVIGDLTEEQIAIIKDGFVAAGVDKKINFTKDHDLQFVTIDVEGKEHANIEFEHGLKKEVWVSKNGKDRHIIKNKVILIEEKKEN